MKKYILFITIILLFSCDTSIQNEEFKIGSSSFKINRNEEVLPNVIVLDNIIDTQNVLIDELIEYDDTNGNYQLSLDSTLITNQTLFEENKVISLPKSDYFPDGVALVIQEVITEESDRDLNDVIKVICKPADALKDFIGNNIESFDIEDFNIPVALLFIDGIPLDLSVLENVSALEDSYNEIYNWLNENFPVYSTNISSGALSFGGLSLTYPYSTNPPNKTLKATIGGKSVILITGDLEFKNIIVDLNYQNADEIVTFDYQITGNQQLNLDILSAFELGISKEIEFKSIVVPLDPTGGTIISLYITPMVKFSAGIKVESTMSLNQELNLSVGGRYTEENDISSFIENDDNEITSEIDFNCSEFEVEGNGKVSVGSNFQFKILHLTGPFIEPMPYVKLEFGNVEDPWENYDYSEYRLDINLGIDLGLGWTFEPPNFLHNPQEAEYNGQLTSSIKWWKFPAVGYSTTISIPECQILPPLGRPTSLDVSLTDLNNVELTWYQGSSLTSKYIIQRRDLNGTFSDIAETEELSYIDNSVEAGNTYFYRVAAYVPWIRTWYTEDAITITEEIDNDTTPPAEVTELTATANEYDVTLNWTDPTDEDFNTCKIYYGIESLNSIYDGIIDSTGTVLEGLSNGTEYTFKVTTIDNQGNESNGTIVLETTSIIDTTPPEEVTDLTATVDEYSVTLSWTNPTDEDFDTCNVYYGIGTTDNIYNGTIDSTGTTIDGLVNGAKYTFIIQTVDNEGNKSTGTTILSTPTLIDTTPPEEVTDLTATADEYSVTLSWINPTDEDFDTCIIYYGIGTTDNIYNGTIDSVGTTINGLVKGAEYTFIVQTVDNEGNKSTGTTILSTPTIIDTTPPAEVTDLTATSDEYSVTLSWTNPSDEDFDTCIIYYGIGSTDNIYNGTIDSAGTTINGLVNDIEYTFVVKTKDIYGNLSEGLFTALVLEEELNVVDFATGYLTLYLMSNGSLWGSGYNYYGSLGNGNTENQLSPVFIMEDVKKYYADSHTTFFIKNDDTLWGSGKNNYGQLGDGTTTNKTSPIYIMEDVNNVISTTVNTFIIKNDNSLWVTGSNDQGQLGIGTTDSIQSMQKVMENVSNVVTDGIRTFIHTTTDELWTCGYNERGELGNGTRNNILAPEFIMSDVSKVSIYQDLTLILRNDQTLWTTGYTPACAQFVGSSINTIPIQVMYDVSDVFTSDDIIYYIKADNTLWGVGKNNVKTLGDIYTRNNSGNLYQEEPVIIMNNVKIVSGTMNTLYIHKLDDSIWVVGNNYYKNLGIGNLELTSTPIKILDNVKKFDHNFYDSIIYQQEDDTLLGVGRGIFGIFGNGSTSTLITPTVLDL